MHLAAWNIGVHQRYHDIVLEPVVHRCVPSCHCSIPVFLSLNSHNTHVPDRVEVFWHNFTFIIFLGWCVTLAASNQVGLHTCHSSEHDEGLDVYSTNNICEAVWQPACSPLLRQYVIKTNELTDDNHTGYAKKRVKNSLKAGSP